ncbi:hypothetical protein [Corallococcus carmarthensis]|uniref:hypothetical protein n=1 Tax=Corallococcus carmarthensis TaxID=2316728 RepID=UPI0020A54214|nr:hypothetical protein [Corallococcus carmarthensis]
MKLLSENGGEPEPDFPLAAPCALERLRAARHGLRHQLDDGGQRRQRVLQQLAQLRALAGAGVEAVLLERREPR